MNELELLLGQAYRGGGSGGGGGGGVSRYAQLPDKPQINGNVLSGNKTGADLGLVDAEAGKGLSANNYTTAEKDKLASLENYDDTALAARVSANETAIADRYTKTETDALIEAEHVELTQAEYDALSDAEKNNGKVYFITDGQVPSGGDVFDIYYNETSFADVDKAIKEKKY